VTHKHEKMSGKC